LPSGLGVDELAGLQEAFAADLDQLRRLAGLSVAELAKRAGQPSSSVGDLLRGEWVRTPSWDRVSGLVAACVAALPSGAADGAVEETRRLGDLGWWREQHADLVRRLTRRARKPGSDAEIVRPVGTASLVGRVLLPSEMFVGRSEELARLESVVAGSGRAVVVAVHGLGGVGKSTLVARFVELNGDRFELVWWVTGDAPGAIDNGLADLAVTVTPGTASAPLEQRVEAALRWLSTHRNWLLVLDNLATPADADVVLSRVRTGTVVITSRRSTGWRGIPAVAVDVLQPAEAEELLVWTVHADWPEADLDGAARLCAELGWLPLAVHQAGSYLAHTRITPAAYLTLLDAYPARMFTATGEGGDAERTMARIWHVTLDRLADTPAAGSMLRQLAWYAPDNIPRVLVTGTSPDPETLDALGRLAAYSMITLEADTISVHRLVQAVTRTPDPLGPHRRAKDITHARDTVAANLARTLAEADPGLPADWVLFEAVLPHARTLLGHTDPSADTESHCFLADRCSVYLCGQGNITAAITLSVRATHGLERLHGSDHPNTLGARDHLATAYQAAGDWSRAIPLYEANQADWERVLGPDHPNTLTSRNNLGHAYQAAGDWKRAIPLLEANQADWERVLGPDHPDTLTSRNNLALAYQEVGDLGRATPLFEATLASTERVLGPDHPSTLRARDGLAGAYHAAGDWERAIPLLEANLASTERALGPDHPSTLTSRNHLAYARSAVGELGQAIQLYEANLADRERVLGPHHPATLISRSNLAAAYQEVGNLERATSLYEAALADFERVLGPDHPNTLRVRDNLAGTYQAAGDLGRAIPLFEATLDDVRRILGPEHPHTLASRNNLAYAYRTVGNLSQAIQLYETNLADRERVLGPDHPDTLASRNDLAGAYQEKGDSIRAIPLFEAILADAERVLGPDHPDTLTLRNNLAGAYQTAGDPGQAISLLETTLNDRERVLGPDHPHTMLSRNNLAGTYQDMGDSERAIPLFQAALADAERVLGPDHPDTLRSRNNLAGAYQAVGDLEEVIPLLEATLADRTRVLGVDHPDTLLSRKNLACAYETAGDLEQAVPLFETSLADAERVLGTDHPLTKAIQSDIEKLISDQTDPARSICRFPRAMHE